MMIEMNIEGLPITGIAVGDLAGGVKILATFDNGYQASIIRHDFSYGLEMAVMHGGNIVYDTPVTDNVLGHLDEDSLREALEAVSVLPRR